MEAELWMAPMIRQYLSMDRLMNRMIAAFGMGFVYCITRFFFLAICKVPREAMAAGKYGPEY